MSRFDGGLGAGLYANDGVTLANLLPKRSCNTLVVTTFDFAGAIAGCDDATAGGISCVFMCFVLC